MYKDPFLQLCVFKKKNLDRSLGANIQTDVSSGPSLNDFVEGY